MVSPRNNRKHLSLVLVVSVALTVCAVAANSFDKAAGKSPLGEHHHQLQQRPGLDLSRDPVEQHHQQQQDLLAAAMGGYQYQLPPTLEDELEQRLLLSSLLESGNQNSQNHLGG